MGRLEVLKAEIGAIDQRDRLYWQTEEPEPDERLEYLLRQDRRGILVAELLELMQRTEIAGSTWSSPKTQSLPGSLPRRCKN
jgi:hypothetical protein